MFQKARHVCTLFFASTNPLATAVSAMKTESPKHISSKVE
jgi:hypothetical protein